MIISRTPYRVSYFGGGTDYHTWYQEHGAAVLTTTINHYCYLICRLLPPFFNHTSRVVWSIVEEVASHDHIKHPSVKAVLDYFHINQGVEIHHHGDLPARSGLGSSSAFTVGLLNALYALQGRMVSKRDLACQAVHIERNVLKENVGVQDQIQTAFGGLNKIVVRTDGGFDVSPIILPQARLQEFKSHLLLFFTGVSRTASDIAGDKMKAIPQKKVELHRMQEMVDEAIKILCEDHDITEFGELLNETWQLKRQITSKISSNFIDDIYARAQAAGAIGGKLLGAGGGGFILFFAKPEDHPRILDALKDILLVPFDFEVGGSQIIFYDNLHYSQTAMTRRDFAHLHTNNPAQSKTQLNVPTNLSVIQEGD